MEDVATRLFRERVEARTLAMMDPRRKSRWSLRRRRADDAFWDADTALKCAEIAWRDQLVFEAIERVREDPQHQLEHHWQEPDVDAVLDDVKTSTGVNPLITRDSVAQLLYSGRELLGAADDLDVVLQHARGLDEHDSLVMSRRDIISRPNRSAGHLEHVGDPELVELLNSPRARLPRPVTMWRGEHPSDYDPAFTTTAHNARPGDILRRGHRPLSATMNPAVAAFYDFCWIPLVHAPRTATRGWILQISTDQAIYHGDREDGLAHEQEILVRAPKLKVADVFEGLVDTRWGLKRVQVIACTPA